MAGKRPRTLVTGFSSFPGVPANPTEALIGALAADPARLKPFGDVRLEVLPVEYGAIPSRLEALGRDFAPEVAVHFGVSRRATGFTIETVARNVVCTVKPDDAGHVPSLAYVCDGAGDLGTSLPVEAMVRALESRKLPAVLSEDAGDYLCNFLFYLSRGQRHPPFAPEIAGFIHVPPIGTALDDRSGRSFDLAMLVDGALAIVGVCAAERVGVAPESGKAALGARGAL